MKEPDPEAVRAHLNRIVESSEFVKADRLCRFLRFTVEARLNGQEGQIKEYVLGREVFDRNGGYDPRVDPIVRVEARRLRTRLEEYYSGGGKADAVHIEYPKGSYVPVFRSAEGAPGVIARPRVFPVRSFTLWISGVALLVVGMLLGYRLSRPSASSDIVAVAPAGWLWGETADAEGLEESLAERVSVELANRHAARVIGWPLMLRYRTARQEFRQMAAGVGASKVLLIRSGEHGVAVFLLDAVSGEKSWVDEYAKLDNTRQAAEMIVKGYVAKRKDIAAAR
jgi:hypothetical protein